MRRLNNWIGGKWLPSASEHNIELRSPHSGELLAQCPASTTDDVDLAVSAAAGAQPRWAALPLADRIVCLERFAAAVAAQADELAALQRTEMGQPLGLGGGLIAQAVDAVRTACRMATTYEFVRRVPSQAGTSTVLRRPLGVTGLITPWNSPVLSVLSQAAPLLLAGNTLVVKPSELSPLSASRLMELADLPPGVLNLVHGDGRAGSALTAHPAVRYVNFTGSVGSGRSVALATAQKLTRATLELGGKDPVIVDKDVDVADVAAQVAFGSFLNTGQICTSMERVYVHENIADPFVAALVEAARSWAFDDGTQEGLVLGPLVSRRQRDRVHEQVSDAVREGATVLLGGEIPSGPGNFYPATVVAGVNGSMRLMTEETFGPIAAVEVVETFEEGLVRAADSQFGLAATVYTNDPGHHRAASEIPAALTWINQWQGKGELMIYEPTHHSGVGATGGAASFDAATRPQTVFVSGPPQG